MSSPFASHTLKLSPFVPSALLYIALFCFAPCIAWAQTVRVGIEGNDGVYEGETFTFSVVVSDFDETPTPEVTPPTVEGCSDCTVSFAGMTPRVSSMIQIINGRRSEYREVTFVYQYQVLVPRAGTYKIPSIIASQNGQQIQSGPVSIQVDAVASTQDMMLRMTLPDRPLWVGERFVATLDWYIVMDALQHYQQRDLFSGQIQQQLPPYAFDVPAWRLPGLDVRLLPNTQAPGRGQARFTFQTNGGDIVLPSDFSEVAEAGRQWGRLRFQVEVTPQRPGTLTLPPSRVTAQLPVQRGRRLVGLRFKTEDSSKTLEVRAMPSQRPASFRNAVGAGFSLEAKVDRSVVRVGDPIELQLTIRGDADLSGLILPALDGPGGLSTDLFSVTATPPTGEAVEEPGQPPARRFRVPIRIRNAAVKEIPPLPFSFFDPSTGTFKTVHSDPVALSVRDATVVGAQDVVSSTPANNANTTNSAAPNNSNTKPPKPPSAPNGSPDVHVGEQKNLALVGVELGLSEEGQALAVALTRQNVWGWMVGLYGVPVLIAGWFWYRQRTARSRTADSGERAGRAALQKALDRSAQAPAKDSISELVGALHGLAKALGWSLTAEDRALIGQLETVAYDPRASQQPLSGELRAEVGRMAARWKQTSAAADTHSGPGSRTALGLLLLAGVWCAQEAHAEVSLEEARTAYQGALSTEGEAKVQKFARAQAMFGALITKHPDSPNLLTDWGHAALGARDIGGAVLAYRRALALDPQQERARKNLEWIRAQALPAWAVETAEGGALDAFLFWHRRMTAAGCLLWGAVAFGVGVLLWVPWPKKSVRSLRPLVVVPAVLWVWLTAAGLAAPTHEGEAVVVGDDLPLRVADSIGAAKVMEAHLPAGCEVKVLERRGEWSRVEMAGGKQGWLPSAALGIVL